MHLSEYAIREMFCEIGRRVWQREYIAANDGNFTQRIGGGLILATPTGVSKGFMRPEDMVVIDADGVQVSGNRKVTSEIRMHVEILKRRPDVDSVLHVHPPHATSFAVLQQPIPKCVLAEIEVFVGEIPIVPYETPGTQAFADAIRPFVNDFQVFMLANHGTVTLGKTIEDAYYKTESIEQYCRILLYCRMLGDINFLSQRNLEDLLKTKARMGIPDRRLSAGAAGLPCGLPAPAPAAHIHAQATGCGCPAGANRPATCPCGGTGICTCEGACPCKGAQTQPDPSLESLIENITREVLRARGLA